MQELENFVTACSLKKISPFQKKDIKDRLFMSETEGIVLSPQRRSFTTGCQMNKDPPKDADNPSGNSSNTASKSSSQDRGERGSEKVISRAPSPKLSYIETDTKKIRLAQKLATS